jgi:hypothetical protein
MTARPHERITHSEESLLRQGERTRFPNPPEVDVRKHQQRADAEVSRCKGLAKLLEQKGCALEIAGELEMVGQLEPPLVHLWAPGRRQPHRELAQRSRSLGRSAQARSTGRILDDLGHALVRSVARKREVARSLLPIAHRVRQRRMHLTA